MQVDFKQMLTDIDNLPYDRGTRTKINTTAMHLWSLYDLKNGGSGEVSWRGVTISQPQQAEMPTPSVPEPQTPPTPQATQPTETKPKEKKPKKQKIDPLKDLNINIDNINFDDLF
jgi:hypothetical protein